MKKTLKIMAATALLLAVTSVNSRAALTLDGWAAEPSSSVTQDGVTWTLNSYSLPGDMDVSFFSATDMRIQDTGGFLSAGTWTLDYTITLASASFTGVSTDSTISGGATTVVAKDVSEAGIVGVIASASSINGASSGVQAIAGTLSALDVSETVTITDGFITGFANTYFIASTPEVPAVPEPSTVVAGLLLLFPLGLSALRIVRRNRAA